MTDPENTPPDATCVAFLVTNDKWIPRIDGVWRTDVHMTDRGMEYHLLSQGWTTDAIAQFKKAPHVHVAAYGTDMVPGRGPLVVDERGLPILNMWVPPTIVPKPGTFEPMNAVLKFFTHSPAELEWITQWLAYTVQQPAALPKVAVVFTSMPGAGKGFLARVVQAILGEENCATIKQGELENKFNVRWIQKLFILADEVLSNEKVKDISQKLKILIDGNEQELEGKGTNQRAVKNRVKWFFASNDFVSPVMLETGDRRFSVFSNTEPPPEDYRRMLDACFEEDRVTFTPKFREEIAAFAHYLLNVKVDTELITRPCDTAARRDIIHAGKTSVEAFCEAVTEEGIDVFIERMKKAPRHNHLTDDEAEWNFGAGGVSTKALYAMYKLFCEDTGQRPVKTNKLGVALKKRWPSFQPITPSRARPRAYAVPRSPAGESNGNQ